MSKPVLFPTTSWFERLAEQMAVEEEAYRSLGPMNCTMIVKVDLPDGRSELIEVIFEGFRAKSVRPLESIDDASTQHFVLEAPLIVWQEMIDNIREHGHPDLEHTINSLTFPDDPMHVLGPDQLEIDAFYRYNESLQRFFNGAAHVETAYAA